MRIAVVVAAMLLAACAAMDNGCQLRCKGCDEVELNCDMHGRKAEGIGAPM